MQKLILVILLFVAIALADGERPHYEQKDLDRIKELRRFFVPQFEEIREFFDVNKNLKFSFIKLILFLFIYRTITDLWNMKLMIWLK